MPSNKACSLSIHIIVLVVLFSNSVLAEENDSNAPGKLKLKIDKLSQQINLLIKQDKLQKKEINSVKKEIESKSKEIEDIRFQQGLISKNKSDQKLTVRLNNKYHLGNGPFGPKGDYGRYFVSEIIIINLTSEPITITKDMITLLVDGKPFYMNEIPSSLKRQSFSLSNQIIQFSSLRQMKNHKLLPGGSITDWMIFTHLPLGNHIPKLHLKIEPKDHKINIDINDYSQKQLSMTVEEIGPKNSLALLNISGIVNTINLGHIVKVLDQLTAKNITRVVIHWSDSAQPVDGIISNWFRQAVLSTPRNYNHTSLPVMPASIRELHLSNFPNLNSNSHMNRAKTVYHKDQYEAVQAALDSAFEILPRALLLEEIRNGHPLTKAAAIASGGGRLPPEDLPIILKLADDDDIHIQKSALVALRHFGEEEALNKLIVYVKKNSKPLAKIATESLALSRYSLAQEFLLTLLKNEPLESKKQIVKILAEHPRLAWNEVIYEHAIDPNGGIVLESLKALVQIGHPKLLDVLKNSLKHPKHEISELAFNLLAKRYDSESENIAINHALDLIKKRGLNNQIISLLNRTKDPRAIPILLKRLDQQGINRKYELISTLANIGDQSVAEEFYKRYGKYGNREKKEILKALLKLNSDRFYQLAKNDINNSDTGIIQVISQGLQHDSSPQSIQLLIKGFEQATNKSTMSTYSRALATLATQEARIVFYKNEYHGVGHKKTLASSALRTIREKTPGFQNYLNAIRASKTENWKKTVEYCTASINTDPLFAKPYVERGRVYLILKKIKEAHADFLRATELNPYNSFAVTGIGTAYIAEGKIELAIKSIEEARDRFPKEALFTYNSACVYSLGCEYLKKQTVQNKELIAQYEKQAIKDLKLSIDYGFNNLQENGMEWIKTDPDLNTLHELEEFKKIIHTDEKPSSSPKPKSNPKAQPKG